MRVTSALYVGALVRRVQIANGFATIMRRGAEEAGAVHIVLRARDGQLSLYSPSMSVGHDDERVFALRVNVAEDMEIDAILEREATFDTDLWAVEIEGDFDELPFVVAAD